MSIDLGQIDQIDYRESIRRKLTNNGSKRINNNRQEAAWGGSLRNLVVQQSLIRVSNYNKLENVEETLDTCSNLIRFEFIARFLSDFFEHFQIWVMNRSQSFKRAFESCKESCQQVHSSVWGCPINYRLKVCQRLDSTISITHREVI